MVRVRLARPLAAIVVAWGLLLAPPALAQQGDDVAELNAQIAQLRRAGNYEQAILLAQRVLALSEHEFGTDDPQVIPALKNYALLYQFQGRDAEAEPLIRRALTISERSLGPDDPHLVEDLHADRVLQSAGSLRRVRVSVEALCDNLAQGAR